MSRYGVLVPDAQRTRDRRMAAFYGFSGAADRCGSPGAAQNAFCNKYISGDKNPEVAQVQAALKKLGYDPGPIDGIVGPKTLDAAAKYAYKVDQVFDGGISQPLIDYAKKLIPSYVDPGAGQSVITSGGGASIAPVRTSVTSAGAGGFTIIGAASSDAGAGGSEDTGPSKTMVIGLAVGALALGGLIWAQRRSGRVPVLQGIFNGLFGGRHRRRRRRARR